jgi:hypothetical protein
MMDDNVEQFPHPPPLKIKRPYHKRRRKKRATPQYGTNPIMPEVRALQKENEAKSADLMLRGLTSGNCPIACGPNCIISGDICVHPHKGGLQAPHRMRPDVMRRYEQAVKMLKHMAVEKS